MTETDRKPFTHTHGHLFICCDCADRQSLLRSLWREWCAGGYRHTEPQQIKPFGEKSCSLNTFFPWAAHSMASEEDEEEEWKVEERGSVQKKGLQLGWGGWWKRKGERMKARWTEKEERRIKDGSRQKQRERDWSEGKEEDGGGLLGWYTTIGRELIGTGRDEEDGWVAGMQRKRWWGRRNTEGEREREEDAACEQRAWRASLRHACDPAAPCRHWPHWETSASQLTHTPVQVECVCDPTKTTYIYTGPFWSSASLSIVSFWGYEWVCVCVFQSRDECFGGNRTCGATWITEGKLPRSLMR